MKTYVLQSPEDLADVAAEFLEDFGQQQLFAFYAPMGAGKTTFIKALCEYLDVEDLVTSPTFAILNEYYTPDDMLICHYDFYRIEKEEEIMRTGFDEYLAFADKIFIEWPENAPGVLPRERVNVYIEIREDHRLLKAEVAGR
ncbi:MAG: tRNA (adenosine(37)-N6)-threonylcarbamoyltransferase complex ATPase subunit type 1 TsaE [Bacteroidales bacterium]